MSRLADVLREAFDAYEAAIAEQAEVVSAAWETCDKHGVTSALLRAEARVRTARGRVRALIAEVTT